MAVFGNQNIESTLGTPGANTKNASKFTLSEAGTVSKLTMYCANTGASKSAGNAKGIIYSDAAGAPNALKGTSNEVAFAYAQAAGWVDFTFATPVLLAPGNYWLGIITDATAPGCGVYRGSTGGYREWNADTYSDGPADPWGTHANAGTFPYSIYATYTSAAAGCPKMTDHYARLRR